MKQKKLTNWRALASFIDHPLVQPEPMSGCWIWCGSRGTKGHGDMGKAGLAHRNSWVKAHGPIPAGKWVLHRCNLACCCNPDHLYLGSHDDNMRDMKESGRRRWKTHGERSGRARLTEDQVLEIRRLSKMGIAQSLLGTLYGVSKACIAGVTSGRNWSYLNA